MAQYTVQELGQDGLEPTLGAVASSDTYPNDERTFLYVDSASAQAVVTIAKRYDTVFKEGFGVISLADIVVTVDTGEFRLIKAPLGSHSAADGLVTVTYSTTSGVTAAAIRLVRE